MFTSNPINFRASAKTPFLLPKLRSWAAYILISAGWPHKSRFFAGETHWFGRFKRLSFAGRGGRDRLHQRSFLDPWSLMILWEWNLGFKGQRKGVEPINVGISSPNMWIQGVYRGLYPRNVGFLSHLNGDLTTTMWVWATALAIQTREMRTEPRTTWVFKDHFEFEPWKWGLDQQNPEFKKWTREFDGKW